MGQTKPEFRVSLSDLPLITQGESGDYEWVFSFWRENWQSFFFSFFRKWEIGKAYNTLIPQIISQLL